MCMKVEHLTLLVTQNVTEEGLKIAYAVNILTITSLLYASHRTPGVVIVIQQK